MQYFSLDASKNLTPARAAALEEAGVEFGVVWEFTAKAMLGGHAQGVKDATQAQVEADACKVPTIPIYFGCDFDAAPGDQDAIDAYLTGAASVLTPARVGLYGGYWPVSRARAAGKCRYTWGTVAWSGNNWATSDWKPNIMQGPFVNIGGVTCDLDAAYSTDFGQWPRPKVVRTWADLKTSGAVSLQQIAHRHQMSPSHILRVTAIYFQRFDAVTAKYLNDVFSGEVAVTAPVPRGATLRVLLPLAPAL
jgi:hypothetical protein